MKQPHFLLAGMLPGLLLWLSTFPPLLPWGFFGHRLINKMAVFTLPPEMIAGFKPHLEYLSDHAVDPDKRRYATHFEAVRHYIDLDHWGDNPFDSLPRDWTRALVLNTHYEIYTQIGDTLELFVAPGTTPDSDSIRLELMANGKVLQDVLIPAEVYRTFVIEHVRNAYYEERRLISCAAWRKLPGMESFPLDCESGIALEPFSVHGMLPYFLPQIQYQLTEAFRLRQPTRILRLSAEIGHYIADAHVPLHTTKNYNGQLSGQTGIHAFWESRLPELYALEQYNFFVGKATYIADIQNFYWDIVQQSHLLVDSVLHLEKQLSTVYPSDAQSCFEERLGVIVRTPCTDYAQAYHKALNGMVERRMRGAIQAIGSAWLTAWVDAGQPDLSILKNKSDAAQQNDTVAVLNQNKLPALRVRPHEE